METQLIERMNSYAQLGKSNSNTFPTLRKSIQTDCTCSIKLSFHTGKFNPKAYRLARHQLLAADAMAVEGKYESHGNWYHTKQHH